MINNINQEKKIKTRMELLLETKVLNIKFSEMIHQLKSQEIFQRDQLSKIRALNIRFHALKRDLKQNKHQKHKRYLVSDEIIQNSMSKLIKLHRKNRKLIIRLDHNTTQYHKNNKLLSQSNKSKIKTSSAPFQIVIFTTNLQKFN